MEITNDEIKLTTWPRSRNAFFRVSSNALLFDVKAPGFVGVGLAAEPSRSCDYWIGIGDTNSHSWIAKAYGENTEVVTPGILSADEYRTFWMVWTNRVIRLGRDGEMDPIIKYVTDIDVATLKYVTFSILDRGISPAYWKFELPPVIPKPLYPPINGEPPKWVPAHTQLPDGAMIGGFEEESLYIIRSPHNGSLTPGKFVPSEGLGYVPWGGLANEKNVFEVLCGYDCIWEKTYQNMIPVGAVIGGYSEVDGEKLFVGRAEHHGHIIPGKVQPSHNVCYIAYQGREIGKEKYEILVVPGIDSRCATKLYFPHLPALFQGYYYPD